MTIKLNRIFTLQYREETVRKNQSLSTVRIVTLAIVSLLVGVVPAMATTYYVDSVNGSDSNNGTTTMTPWKTLSKASAASLSPGDTVSFKRGDTFSGQLIPGYSGAAGNQITYTSYGTGALPIINPQGMSGGDPAAAIDVENLSHLAFVNISVTNPRITSRSGVSDTTAYGLLIHNTGGQTITDFLIKGVTVTDVYSIALNPNPADDLQASIGFIDDSASDAITNITVENSVINNGTRFGILADNTTTPYGNTDTSKMIQNITVNNVTCTDTGGSCFMSHQAESVLVEYSTFTNTGSKVSNDGSQGPMMGKGSGGWVIDSRNVVVAYNTAIGATGDTDSSWFHTDNNNNNVLVEYNFGYNCEGAGIEILSGNDTIIYRYNVSVDNGWRTTGKLDLAGMVAITDTGGGENHGVASTKVYVYGNTFVYSKNSQNVDFSEVMTSGFMYNNIFSATGGAHIVLGTTNGSSGNLITNNLFNNAASGVVALDADPIIGVPNFVGGPKNNPASFKLASGSIALNAGVTRTDPGFPALGAGMFAAYPTTPTVDYYGNPLTSPFNLGADQQH